MIYPKDTAVILLWGDIFPGASVVEIGSGPGALTIALLRSIGSTGRLTTVEIREDHCEMARGNVARFFGEAPNWSLQLADAYEGFVAQDIDRLLIDLPEPWRILPHAAKALRYGGVLVGYIPTVVQVSRWARAPRQSGFTIEVMENLHGTGVVICPYAPNTAGRSYRFMSLPVGSQRDRIPPMPHEPRPRPEPEAPEEQCQTRKHWK